VAEREMKQNEKKDLKLFTNKKEVLRNNFQNFIFILTAIDRDSKVL